MAGAEGERRLDLDGDVVGPNRAAVMRAVDEHAAGPHRLQAVEARRDPVLLVHRREGGCVDDLADDRPQQVAHSLFIRVAGEIDLDLPGRIERERGDALLDLEGGDRRLRRVEDLAEQFGQSAGVLTRGGEFEDGRNRRWQEAFAHALP